MSIKTQISKIIRLTGFADFADKCRFYHKYCRNFFINKKYVYNHPDVNFPKPYFLYETYGLNYKHYYEDGLATATEIINLIEPYIDFNHREISLLDWGCGPGRVVRHLPDLLPLQSHVYGCDYNPEYINWCCKNIPNVLFTKNDLHPPTSFSENSFHFIYALSILTHLSLSNHFAWIAELKRLLKEGGLLLITTQGSMFKEKLMPEELKKFNKGELVIRTTKKEGHRVFAAFQPEEFMVELLSSFEIIKYIPGGTAESIHGKQDNWLVRKIIC